MLSFRFPKKRREAAERKTGVEIIATPPKGRQNLTVVDRAVRRTRIFRRLSEGWAYEEIAQAEGLTARRVRQIIAEVLRDREVEDGTAHARLQLARLAPALRVAGEAVAQGEVKAIAPLIKVLDRLDRYQRTAEANDTYDEDVRDRLLDRLNRRARLLREERARREAEAAARAGAESPPQIEAPAPEAEPKEIWPGIPSLTP
jgi:hypothetical protein